ncbi:MAG: DUF2652 domain-containing protein [Pseudomonadales bacterium]
MQQDRLIVVLADISGYTRFMIENRTSAVHGQLCINSLIEAILAHVDIPLTLQEIEGDAVFLYARHPGTESGWAGMLKEISEKLDRFFEAFIAETGISAESTPCACAICRNADKLGLKIIVHVGDAVFHDVAGRSQVSGPDVILAHRLLKNSVDSNDYLLLTERAYQAMLADLKGEFEPHAERYEGFGNVTAFVRRLDQRVLDARDAIYRMSEADAQHAVGEYIGWVRRHIDRAVLQQIRSPTSRLTWKDRLLLIWEQVVLYRLGSPSLKTRIRRTQRQRGHRREQWGPPEDPRFPS